MTAQSAQFRSACEIPELDCPVAVTGREYFAIGAESKQRLSINVEGHRLVCVIMADAEQFVSARNIPELDRVIPTSCGGECPAVWAEGDGRDV